MINPLLIMIVIEILALISVIGFALQLAYVIPAIKKGEIITKKRIVKTILFLVCSVVLICFISLG